MTTNFTNEHAFTTDRDISSVAFWGEPEHQVSNFLRMVRRLPVSIG